MGPINQVQNALQLRADWVMDWRKAPQGSLVDIVGGKLLLSHFPDYTKLTIIYETTSEAEDGPRTIERGRRVAGVGPVARMYAIALDLATYGIRGGPTFMDGPWVWERGEEDGWQHMLVPDGELRLSAPDGPDGKCSLIHDVGSYIELLAVDREADLERAASVYWEKRRIRPLRVIVDGKVANLRSLDEVASLIGYHPVTDNSFVALVRAEDELALCYVEGMSMCLAVKVSWERALSGEPFNVDELLRTASGPVNHGPANHGPAANDMLTVPVNPPGPQVSTPGVSGARASCPPDCTPMPEAQRALCRRYIKRLHRRLRGRGGRKARQLVLLILAEIDRCRHDLTGTRQEVNSALEQTLGQHLPGGDRNIRDAIDLLIEHSLFAFPEDPPDGKRCTLVLSQFHDPDSELMRRIAAEAAEVAAAEVADGTRTGAPSAMTADATRDSGPSFPDTSAAPELSPTTATASATPPAGSRVMSRMDGPAQTSETWTRTSSAHVFQAFVQSPAARVAQSPSQPTGRGDSCVSRDASIVPRPVKPRSADTSLRGFTDRIPHDGEPSDPGTRWDRKASEDGHDSS